MNELWLVLGMAAATIVTRYPLLAMAGRIRVGPRLRLALSFVPPTVLAAIVAPAVLMPEGHLDLGLHNPRLIAAAAAVALSLWRRQLGLTIAGGLAVYGLLLLLQ